MRNLLLFVVIIAIFVSFNGCTTDPKSFPLEQAVANGKPTLAEFGGTNCVPCKSMWPILDELAKEYEGKLNIVIVDVANYWGRPTPFYTYSSFKVMLNKKTIY